MDRLTSMSVFVKIVAHHSFAAAAREMGLSRAGVSKHVLELEQSLGAHLGEAEAARVAVEQAGALQTTPKGMLRISAPISIGLTHLAAVTADYMARYPEVSIDMVLNDRAVDLIEEGFDAAIRIGHLTDSTLIARRIAPVHFVLCSSPNYLANRGTPQRPSDLQHHNCVVYSLREGHGEWRFTGPDGEEAVLISGRLKANNGNFLRVAVIKGEGIGLAPTFLVGEDLTAGRLVPLMPDYTPVESDLTVVYPHRRQLSAKVRSFVDFLAARFAGEPEWDRWRDQTRSREARRIDK